jgi:hypothetical protein
MSGSERFDSKAGPLGGLSQAYFGGLDAMVKGYEPALKGVGRWNLELIGLMTRRSQAWLGLPARLSQCKSPLDVCNEQMRFWQTAASDFSQASHRLAAAFGACAVLPHLNGAPQRDYISFPEAKEPPATPKRSDRKAA